jgi:hypothetical protein
MVGTSKFLGSVLGGLGCNHLMCLGNERRQEWMMWGYQPSCWGGYSHGRFESASGEQDPYPRIAGDGNVRLSCSRIIYYIIILSEANQSEANQPEQRPNKELEPVFLFGPWSSFLSVS